MKKKKEERKRYIKALQFLCVRNAPESNLKSILAMTNHDGKGVLERSVFC